MAPTTHEETQNTLTKTLENTPGYGEALKSNKESLISPENPAQERHWTLIESIGRRITELQVSVKNSAPGVELSRALGQLRTLSHDRSRLLRPALLKSTLLTKNEELRKAATSLFGEKFDEDEQKFLDTVAPKDLIKLEQIQRGVLAKFYAFKEVNDESGNILEEPIDINNLKEGDNIRIDFGKNAKANAKIGAGDILPAGLNVVKIIDTNGNIRIGHRDIVGGHIGYYDANGRYLPIFNGYRIHVPTASEVTGDEYQKFGVTSVFETDAEKLKNLEAIEREALGAYQDRLEKNEKSDKISEKVSELKSQAGSDGSYQDQIKKAIEIGEKELASLKSENKIEDKETIELTSLAIERLKNTLKIFEGKDIKGLDIDRYKSAIAAHESGGMIYFARNDDYGKRQNPPISSEKWAFGKYQFTTETLRGLGVDLGRPPEESEIQKFLGNSTLQEEIMDKFVSNLLEKHILTNSTVMDEVAKGTTSIVYFLALAHNGGPGAIKNGGTATDYMSKKSAASYARAIADKYESGEDASFLANLGRKPRIEAWADKTNPEDLISSAQKHIGEKYVWGGVGDGRGVDCSGLVVAALQERGVVSSSYDNSAAGFFDGTIPKKPQDVKRGDLVFLQSGGRITHVEIATGPVQNGEIPILDASSATHNAGKVTERTQKINSRVLVGTPLFYS